MFKRLDEDTSIPFKIVVPLMLSIVTGVLWIQSTLASVRAELKATITRAEVLEWRHQFVNETHTELKATMKRVDMIEWRDKLAEQNRTLSVPYLPIK